jgi:hypothetical protein
MQYVHAVPDTTHTAIHLHQCCLINNHRREVATSHDALA